MAVKYYHREDPDHPLNKGADELDDAESNPWLFPVALVMAAVALLAAAILIARQGV